MFIVQTELSRASGVVVGVFSTVKDARASAKEPIRIIEVLSTPTKEFMVVGAEKALDAGVRVESSMGARVRTGPYSAYYAEEGRDFRVIE